MIGAQAYNRICVPDIFGCRAVGERSTLGRSDSGSSRGRSGSDYAGMSSEKTRGKRVRRKSKVSWGRLIHPGLVDPKLRPKGVSDG
jgi:hypothetical protein